MGIELGILFAMMVALLCGVWLISMDLQRRAEATAVREFDRRVAVEDARRTWEGVAVERANEITKVESKERQKERMIEYNGNLIDPNDLEPFF
jgi:hypothetical protein